MQPTRFLARTALCTFILAFAFNAQSHAQRNFWSDDAFGKGDNTLAVGVGFGLDFGFTQDAIDLPSFTVIYDHGVAEMGLGTITLGGIVSYKSVQHQYASNDYSASWTHIMAGMRTTLRVTALSRRVPALDAHPGAGRGARAW